MLQHAFHKLIHLVSKTILLSLVGCGLVSPCSAYVYAEFSDCQSKESWQLALGHLVTHASEQCDKPYLQWQGDNEDAWYQRALLDPNIVWLSRNSQAAIAHSSAAEQANAGSTGGWHTQYLGLDHQPSCLGVTIVVVDTGVDAEHPALEQALAVNEQETYNASDDDNDGFCDNRIGWNQLGSYNANLPEPDETCKQLSDNYNDYRMTDLGGHGTHVTGLIAGNPVLDTRTDLTDSQQAHKQNSLGICGEAKVVMINMLGAWPNFGGSSVHIENAMRYIEHLVAQQPNERFVINHSWTISDGQLASLERFQRLGQNPNVLMVAAAGNSGRFLDGADLTSVRSMPAALNQRNLNMLSVGNLCETGSNCLLNRFSNHGWQSVDLAMPGTNVASTWRNSSYAAQTGTSMAAPLATGLASWLWTQHPNLTASQVKASLMSGVDFQSVYPVRYAGAINTDQLISAPVPVAVFNITEQAGAWLLAGKGLAQVDRATWNGQSVSFGAGEQISFEKRPAGRLALYRGERQVASIWLSPSVEVPQDISWQIERQRVGVSWQPEAAISQVQLQQLIDDEWTTIEQTAAQTHYTLSAQVYQAQWQTFRLVAISNGLDAYGEAESVQVISEQAYSTLQSRVNWQTLALASLTATETQTFELSTSPSGQLSLTSADEGISLQGSQLEVNALLAPESVQLTAVADGYDASNASFSTAFFDDARRFNQAPYSDLLWPISMKGLQLRRNIITGQRFAWGVLPVTDGSARLTLEPLKEDLTLYLANANGWVLGVDESASQYWQMSIDDASELDLDNNPATVTLAVMVTAPAELEQDLRCFIATALIDDARQLEALRHVRDRWLPNSLISYYYHQSPFWLSAMAHRPLLRQFVAVLVTLLAELYLWRWALVLLVIWMFLRQKKWLPN